MGNSHKRKGLLNVVEEYADVEQQQGSESLKIKQLPVYIQIEPAYEEMVRKLGKDLKMMIS